MHRVSYCRFRAVENDQVSRPESYLIWTHDFFMNCAFFCFCFGGVGVFFFYPTNQYLAPQ